MNGQLLVDGIDVYTAFGAYVTEGGYNTLVSWASLKSPTTYDFPEEKGVEVDLTNPLLDTRTIGIKFAFREAREGIEAFLRLLSNGAYHSFNFSKINRTYRLRLVNSGSLDLLKHLGSVELKFADDFPLRGYAYNNPNSDVIRCEDFVIDGTLLTDFGARVLEGVSAEICALPEPKQNLTIKRATSHGVDYDTDMVRFKQRDFKVKVLFRANTLAELWNNYDALLYNLIRPGERIITITNADAQKRLCAYYKSMTVKEFFPEDKIWLEAEITFVVIDEWSDTILTTEVGNPLLSEAGHRILAF